MSDDFDDDLYNIYNGGGQEDSYNDEDLYGDDPVVDVKEEEIEIVEDVVEEEVQDDIQDESTFSEQQNQQNQHQQQLRYQQNMNNNWGFQPNPYQQYMAAYQRSLQQQMAMNPYQMQQMIQRQIRQQQQPQHYKPNNSNEYSVKKEALAGDDNEDDENKNASVTSAANTDEGKMFIGGLNWETTDESLREYFSQFGQVLDCTVMRDPTTQRSRGFAFMSMKENSDIDKIVGQADHQLDGKRIDPKKAIPRDEQDKTEKIFVGGISQEVNEEEFREFFTQFGTVIDATLMLERDTGRPRGFGFITFESSNGVEEALKNPNLSIKDKTIEVKKAMPKNKQTRMTTTATIGVTPVLNPNFRPQNGYMPNNRYAGVAANFGNMMNANNFNNMYGAGNMYGGLPYNNMAVAAAAAAYYNSGGNNRGYNHDRHSRANGDDNRGNSRDRGNGNSATTGRRGGTVHASQSRNQQHYRPY